MVDFFAIALLNSTSLDGLTSSFVAGSTILFHIQGFVISLVIAFLVGHSFKPRRSVETSYLFGRGTWIRTKIYGVKVRCLTFRPYPYKMHSVVEASKGVGITRYTILPVQSACDRGVAH